MVFCIASLLVLVLTNNYLHSYRNAGILLFELVSCVVVSAMLVVQSRTSDGSLVPTIALISYSALNGIVTSVLTLFATFFLGSSILDSGALVLSFYFCLVAFRTCIFTGFKSVPVMIIRK